jgi:hypothetical protein
MGRGAASMIAGNHSCVPEWVFEHAARIRVVDATHNRLTELPPDRWRLFTLLSKLHIAHNQLSMLPASLCLAVRAKPFFYASVTLPPAKAAKLAVLRVGLRCGVLTAVCRVVCPSPSDAHHPEPGAQPVSAHQPKHGSE